MAELERLAVEVVYAEPTAPFVAAIEVPVGTSVRQAIERSGVLNAHPALASIRLDVGIWGRVQSLDALLAQHDRIEIYRPLINDAKAARRARATRQA